MPLWSRERVIALIAAVAALAAAGYLWRQAGGERDLRAANDAAFERRWDDALREAREAEHGSTRSRALRVTAYVHFRRRDVEAFLPAARRALRARPADWELRRDYALAVLLRGNRAGARKQMALALATNPKMVLPQGFVRRSSVERP